MAKVEHRGHSYTQPEAIADVLAKEGILFEQWGLRGSASSAADAQILEVYAPEVQKLMSDKGYQTADLVALNPKTPKLEEISARYDKEHHHIDDEVRFTVAGQGVFEIETASGGEFLKFTADPGDLIVVPAYRRHLFYLTDHKTIRCIRLFMTKTGWEAIYPKVANA